MEIEINDTPVTTDDLVELKCTRPDCRTIISCRIRATSACPHDSTVVLTNPDGRLRFPNSGDTTHTLTVPGSGAWAAFQISGESGSNAIGDAVIEAHCKTATGPVKASKGVTVFWFDQAQIDVTPVGSYTMSAGRLDTTGGANGVDFSAQARIRPAGVDCTAPQVTNLRVGIMQNALVGIIREKIWSTPSIAWDAGVAPGTTATVPSGMRVTINHPSVANDSATSVAPLYDQPGKADTLEANSLQPPTGCPGGAAATSNDTVSTSAPLTFVVPAVSSTGANVGTVTYTLSRLRLLSDFATWVAIFNTATNDVCVLRQRTWRAYIDSAAAAPRRCTAAPSDTAPTFDPVTAPPFSNAVANDPANRTPAPASAATTTFTK